MPDRSPEPGWDYERELEADERVERRLIGKELLVLLLVAAVAALRLALG